MRLLKVLLASAMFLGTCVAYAYDDEDFQVWNTDVQEKKISKNAKVALEEEFRWGDNASEFFYQHYDIGYFHAVKEWLHLGAGYRHVLEKKKGKFRLENEPYTTVSFLWDWKGFKFDDRSRFEYRHFDYQSDRWRYRNKFTVKTPWEFTKLKINPFVSDEIFVDFEETGFSKNRFYSGLSINLTKNAKAEVYYLIESSKSSHKWSDANILGTKLKVSF